jgi:PiT family inorganic phosphate transporter
MGSGLGKKLASVHWGVVGQMAGAWVLTIPSAAILGGVAWEISDIFGGHSNLGAIVIAVIAVAGAFGLWSLAQRSKITAADLDRTHITPDEEARGLATRQAQPSTAGV